MFVVRLLMDKIKGNTTLKLHELAFQGYGVKIYPVSSCDLPCLRRWRNSKQIGQQMTDSTYISPHQQRIWFENIQGRVDQMNWVVWCKGIRSGFMNVKGEGPIESQKQIGGGYYVGESQVRHGLLGYAIFLMFHDIVFDYFSIPEIKDTVLVSNSSARKLNKMFGYHEVQKNDLLIDISLKFSNYKLAKKKISRYFGGDASCKLIFLENIGNKLPSTNSSQ
jgi:hypothetical protein